jgi:hypothetical protein
MGWLHMVTRFCFGKERKKEEGEEDLVISMTMY